MHQPQSSCQSLIGHTPNLILGTKPEKAQNHDASHVASYSRIGKHSLICGIVHHPKNLCMGKQDPEGVLEAVFVFELSCDEKEVHGMELISDFVVWPVVGGWKW